MDRMRRIGEDTGADRAIPEFEVEKKEEEDIQDVSDEGSIVHREDEADKLGIDESRSFLLADDFLRKTWIQIMEESLDDLDEVTRVLLQKKQRTKKEGNRLRHARNIWWKNHGIKYKAWEKRKKEFSHPYS